MLYPPELRARSTLGPSYHWVSDSKIVKRQAEQRKEEGSFSKEQTAACRYVPRNCATPIGSWDAAVARTVEQEATAAVALGLAALRDEERVAGISEGLNAVRICTQPRLKKRSNTRPVEGRTVGRNRELSGGGHSQQSHAVGNGFLEKAPPPVRDEVSSRKHHNLR